MREYIRCQSLFWERLVTIEEVLRKNGVELPNYVRVESPETRRCLSGAMDLWGDPQPGNLGPYDDVQMVLGTNVCRGKYGLEIQCYLPMIRSEETHDIELPPVNDLVAFESLEVKTGLYVQSGRKTAWIGHAKPDADIWVVLKQRENDGTWEEGGLQLHWEMTWREAHYCGPDWEDNHRDGKEPNHGWELCDMGLPDGFDPAALEIDLEPCFFKEDVAVRHLARIARFFAKLPG